MGPDIAVPNPDGINAEKSPTAVAERGGVGFEDDFRQLSDDAPSDGLITIPERKKYHASEGKSEPEFFFLINSFVLLTGRAAEVKAGGDFGEGVST